MIKLFEEFVSSTTTFKLLETLIIKAFKFFEEIKGKDKISYSEHDRILLSSVDGLEIMFGYMPEIELELFVSLRGKKYKYKLAYEYIDSIMKQHLDYSGTLDTEYAYKIDKLSKEVVDSINFNKEDYELFSDTERFGL